MAEIQLERKEGKNWIWIVLGLLLLALLAWWLLSQRGDNDPVVAETPGMVTDSLPRTGMTGSGEVDGFIQFVDDNRARTEMGRDHEFTAEGIRRLAGALGSVATRDTVGGAALQPRLDSLRQKADSLERNTQSGQHSAQARDAFTSAVAIMDDLRQRRFPNAAGHVTQARQAAEAVQPGQQLLEQKAQVQRFFEHSAEVLRTMSNGTGSPAAGG